VGSCGNREQGTGNKSESSEARRPAGPPEAKLPRKFFLGGEILKGTGKREEGRGNMACSPSVPGTCSGTTPGKPIAVFCNLRVLCFVIYISCLFCVLYSTCAHFVLCNLCLHTYVCPCFVFCKIFLDFSFGVVTVKVTNPRFGMAHTKDTNDVIKPVTFLRDALHAQYSKIEGEERWIRYVYVLCHIHQCNTPLQHTTATHAHYCTTAPCTWRGEEWWVRYVCTLCM